MGVHGPDNGKSNYAGSATWTKTDEQPSGDVGTTQRVAELAGSHHLLDGLRSTDEELETQTARDQKVPLRQRRHLDEDKGRHRPSGRR